MNNTISKRTYKETSQLIADLFNGEAISFAQLDIIVQECMKTNIVSVTDYLDFHVREHKQMQELTATDLKIVANNLRHALRAVEARLDNAEL